MCLRRDLGYLGQGWLYIQHIRRPEDLTHTCCIRQWDLTNKQEIHKGRKLVCGEISRLVADDTEEWLPCTLECSEAKLLM